MLLSINYSNTMQKIRLFSFILISSSLFKRKLFEQIFSSTASPRENISSGFIAVAKNDNRSKEFKDVYVKIVNVDEQQSPPLLQPSGMPSMRPNAQPSSQQSCCCKSFENLIRQSHPFTSLIPSKRPTML